MPDARRNEFRIESENEDRQDGNAGEEHVSGRESPPVDGEAGDRGAQEGGDGRAEAERREVARARLARAVAADEVVDGHVEEDMAESHERRAREEARDSAEREWHEEREADHDRA